MDYKQMTAPCGIDCFNCGVYLAGKNETLRAKVAKSLGVTQEKVACKGCRNEGGTIACISMTEPCKVYKCISKKGYSFCFECPEFPCDNLHPYADLAAQRPHNIKMFNLCLIKKMGLEAWAETKAKKVRSTYFSEKLKL